MFSKLFFVNLLTVPNVSGIIHLHPTKRTPSINHIGYISVFAFPMLSAAYFFFFYPPSHLQVEYAILTDDGGVFSNVGAVDVVFKPLDGFLFIHALMYKLVNDFA